MAHAVIQEALGWKPSDSAAALPEMGEVLQNEEGNNSSELDIPDWDDRVDSLINKAWVERMTVIVVGHIEVSVSSTIQIQEYSHLKGRDHS